MKIKIPKKYKKIGINCSGGADSTILLYLMGHYMKKRHDADLYVITNRNAARDYTQPERVGKIICFLEDTLGYKFVTEHIIIEVQDYTERGRHIEKLFDEGKVDLVMSGVTHNPKIEPNTFIERKDGRIIDLSHFPLPERSKEKTSWFLSVDGQGVHFPQEGKEFNAFYSPFNNIDKSEIIKLYKKAKLFDTLLPMTRSCEGEASETNNFIEECGNCWWCLERKWAIQETEKNC